MNSKRLVWDFNYHSPDDKKRIAYEAMEAECLALAQSLNTLVPDSKEKDLAITKLEGVMFWCIAAISRNPRPEGTE